MGTKDPALQYKFVQQEFEDVGECLNDDLSFVRVSVIKDVHTDSVDLEICIYGQDSDVDSPPVVQCRYSGESDIFDSNLLKAGGAVAPSRVVSLFDADLLDVFTSSGIKIHWNEGDITFEEIDPVPQKNRGLLFVQEH